jgi:hypothetical protein
MSPFSHFLLLIQPSDRFVSWVFLIVINAATVTSFYFAFIRRVFYNFLLSRWFPLFSSIRYILGRLPYDRPENTHFIEVGFSASLICSCLLYDESVHYLFLCPALAIFSFIVMNHC